MWAILWTIGMQIVYPIFALIFTFSWDMPSYIFIDLDDYQFMSKDNSKMFPTAFHWYKFAVKRLFKTGKLQF